MTESAAGRWSQEIQTSIEHTLLEQTRRNELTLAGLRVLTLGLIAAGDWFARMSPPPEITEYPLSTPVITTIWAVFAAAVAAALARGYYRPVVSRLLPAADCLLAGIALYNLPYQLGAEPWRALGGVTTTALACATLIALGALRLNVWISTTTTAVGIAIFVAVIAANGAFNSVTPVHVGMLLAVGVLATWLAATVRRVIASEVGRNVLQRFLPDTVVDQAYTGDLLASMATPRTLDATIVFTDLRGFTSLSEGMSPERALGFLNEVQGTLADVVRRHGGTVDKFLGDGMLAVFGAPQPLPDHAARAVAATREMRTAIQAVSARQSGMAPIRLGVGVHTGPVVAGCVGSGTRLEFTVIGDTVNTASRLESLTKEKGVDAIVSATTVAALAAEARVGLTDLGEATIRGKLNAVGVYALD